MFAYPVFVLFVYSLLYVICCCCSLHACFLCEPSYSMIRVDTLWLIVKRRELARIGHVTRHDNLSKIIILQGTSEDGRHHGQPRKCWMDNIKEWTSLPMPALPTSASCRKDRKRISAESSVISPGRSNPLRD